MARSSIHARYGHFVFSCLGFVLLTVLLYFGISTEQARIEQKLRDTVNQTAQALASRLESELNANAFLANGMVAHILAHDGSIDDSAERALKALHQYGRHIRNIGIAPGNRISRVYPLAGNEAAIGLYYPDLPSQWPGVQAAIDARTTVLAGPVALRQGGVGLISRTPVFLADGRFWGLISIVLDADSVYGAIGLSEKGSMIDYAIRGVDGKGADGEVFFGNPRLFEREPLFITVAVPGGNWQLAALPQGGWQEGAGHLFLLRAIGLVLALLLSIALFGYLRDRRRLAESERRTLALINASQDAACLLTTDGTILAANQVLASRFNLDLDSVIGRCVFDFMPENLKTSRSSVMQQAITSKKSKHFKDQRDGMFFENSVSPIMDSSGRVTFIAAYSRDVTEHIKLQQSYFDKMQQLDAILSSSSVGIALVRDRRQVWCNQVMVDIFGYAITEMEGLGTRAFYLSDEDFQRIGTDAYTALSRGEKFSVEQPMRHKDGHAVWVRMSGKLLSAEDMGQGSIWTFEDIGDRKKAEAEIALAASVYHETLQGIMITDAKGTILSVNDSFIRITGYEREEVLGQTPRLLKSNRQDRSFYDRFWRELTEQGRFEGEVWNRRKNGEAFLIWQTVSAIRDGVGTTTRYVALFSDVTELRQDDHRVRHLAYHDALTDLPNRMLFQDRLTHALLTVERNTSSLALLFLDLDGFKAVNDTLGHDIGDELLKEVARHLLEAVRGTDTVSRLGGDEFVIILESPCGEAEAVEIVNRIISSINQPMEIRGNQVRVGVSVGIALYPRHAPDADGLTAMADAAMYQSKKSGKNTFRFPPPPDA